MVPQSLGYAALAGAPVQAGLYALPLALGVYAFVGSSPQLIVGPVSTVSVLTGSIVASHGAKSPEEALALVAALAVVSGLILIVAGLLRLGWVADFLSKPIVTGFVFGLSILVVLGEIPTLLGLPRGSGNVIDRVSGIAGHLDEIQLRNAAVGAVALAVLFLGPRINKVVPWGLMVVIGGLVIARFVDFPAAGIAEIGKVPGGLPGLAVPDLSLAEMGGLLTSAAALAMVGLAETLSASRLFAAQNGYHIDANREFIGTGAANVAAGLSGGIGVGRSLSKTAAADNSGGRSPLTSLATMGFHRRGVVLRPIIGRFAPGGPSGRGRSCGVAAHGPQLDPPLQTHPPKRLCGIHGGARRRAGPGHPVRASGGNRSIDPGPDLSLEPDRSRCAGQGARGEGGVGVGRPQSQEPHRERHPCAPAYQAGVLGERGRRC
jgi:hypothetical protein